MAESPVIDADDLSKKDELDYQERIKAIDENTNLLGLEAYRELQQELQNLKQFNSVQIKQITNNWQLNIAQKTFQRNCTYVMTFLNTPPRRRITLSSVTRHGA